MYSMANQVTKASMFIHVLVMDCFAHHNIVNICLKFRRKDIGCSYKIGSSSKTNI